MQDILFFKESPAEALFSSSCFHGFISEASSSLGFSGRYICEIQLLDWKLCCEATHTRMNQRSRCPVVRWNVVLNQHGVVSLERLGATGSDYLPPGRQEGREVCSSRRDGTSVSGELPLKTVQTSHSSLERTLLCQTQWPHRPKGHWMALPLTGALLT